MLPPTATLIPAVATIEPTKLVTVVLPLAPVIATIFLFFSKFTSRQNNSISPIISTPLLELVVILALLMQYLD